MMYFLFIIGIIICIYGWRLIKNQDRTHKEVFQEMISDQNNNHGEYIKLLSLHAELKNCLELMQQQLNTILEQTSHDALINTQEKEPARTDRKENNFLHYNEAASKIAKMLENNKSIEEIASELNMGKGEVLLLKRLLTK